MKTHIATNSVLDIGLLAGRGVDIDAAWRG